MSRQQRSINNLRGKLPLPFIGAMKCFLCEREEHGTAFSSSEWRAIDANKHRRFYICAACKPADGSSTEVFTEFYVETVKEIYHLMGGRPLTDLRLWMERDGRLESDTMW